jgi:hypothetical protein
VTETFVRVLVTTGAKMSGNWAVESCMAIGIDKTKNWFLETTVDELIVSSKGTGIL